MPLFRYSLLVIIWKSLLSFPARFLHESAHRSRREGRGKYRIIHQLRFDYSVVADEWTRPLDLLLAISEKGGLVKDRKDPCLLPSLSTFRSELIKMHFAGRTTGIYSNSRYYKVAFDRTSGWSRIV